MIRGSRGGPMPYVIKAIGILFVVLGVLFAAMPALMNRFIEFAKVGKRCYIGGVVRIVIGVLLLIGSLQVSVFWIPVIIGSLITLSGIAIFLLGHQRIHAVMDWIAGLPEGKRRIGPIIAGIFGVLIIYAV